MSFVNANDPGSGVHGRAAALRQCDDATLLRDCRWEAFRASGPGGQKRNKTSSAVRVVHVPSGVSAIANESRSQHSNRAKALERLRHRLTLSVRDDVPAAGLVLPPWFVELTARGNLDLSQRHEHYLPAMGLVLDVLAATGWGVAEAAGQLGLSTAALTRFLEADPKLWAHVNTERAAVGLKPLRGRE